MSAAGRRAARDEALARIAATHRPVAAIIADLRGDTGSTPARGGDDARPPAAAETPVVPRPADPAPPAEDMSAPVDTAPPQRDMSAPGVAGQVADAAEADPAAELRRVVEDALAAGRTPRQRFGEPYCPSPGCYGRDYRALDAEILAAEGVPPYASDCNCTVIVD